MPIFEIKVNIVHTYVHDFYETYEIEADTQEEADKIARKKGWSEDKDQWEAEYEDTSVYISKILQLTDDDGEPLTVRCLYTPDMFADLCPDS